MKGVTPYEENDSVHRLLNGRAAAGAARYGRGRGPAQYRCP